MTHTERLAEIEARAKGPAMNDILYLAARVRKLTDALEHIKRLSSTIGYEFGDSEIHAIADKALRGEK